MIFARARAIADAVLFEGYALYPYRASSLKNQHRWMFGSLFPQGAAEALGEPWRLRCECLLEAPEGAEIEAMARFLRFEKRAAEAWEEASPEDVRVGPLGVGALARGAHRERFAMASASTLGADGIARARSPIEGEVEIALSLLEPGLYRLAVTITNLTTVPVSDAEAARLASMASTHVLLAVRGGGFVSLLDPPPHRRAAAEGCSNTAAWPVLAGAPPDRDLVLCSPIILADHPAVAPESPGNLFDGTEMDEMLTLRILTMTDAEKREAAALDGRVRALLERTEGLDQDQLARLHGAIRSLGSSDGELPCRGLEKRPPRTVRVAGRDLGPGDRVRIHPLARSDILDLALAGQEATIMSIEQDYEDRTFVTVTVDDDPGKDLGARGLPGHRFFFRPDEVEPLDGDGGTARG